MAHVRKTAAGTWQARYRAPDGSERARNFTRKVDADAFLATMEADKLRGEWTDPRRSRITFGEWSDRVQASRVNLAASTRDNDRSVIRSLILPTFQNARLSAIEPAHIRAWVGDLVAAGYSPSTVRRAYTLLQLALNLAVDDGRLARSPCRRIALPKIEQSEKRFLSIEEVEDLAETIRPRYRAFVLAGAYTGLRPGELAALRTDRLDLQRRQLRVEGPIKTPAARRTVSFPPFLAEELTTHLNTSPVTIASSSPPPKADHFASACSVDASGTRPCAPQSVNPCARTICATLTSLSSSQQEKTPMSSPNDSDTHPSAPPTTSTDTSSKAETAKPPTPSKRREHRRWRSPWELEASARERRSNSDTRPTMCWTHGDLLDSAALGYYWQ
jgi:integrase